MICLQVVRLQVFCIGGRIRVLYQLLSVCRIKDVRQTKICTADPLVPGPNSCEIEIAIQKWKKCKSLGIDQITVKLL